MGTIRKRKPINLDKPCRSCNLTPRQIMDAGDKCIICLRSRAFERKHGITHSDAEYRYVWNTWAIQIQHSAEDAREAVRQAFGLWDPRNWPGANR